MRLLVAFSIALTALSGLAAASPPVPVDEWAALRRGADLDVPWNTASESLLYRRQEQNSSEAYPAPKTDGGPAWQAGFERAKALVSQMTLDEKINVTTGRSGKCVGFTGEVPRLGLPALCLQDSPVGVRPARRVSQFPAEITAAATWDRDLVAMRAEYIADEFKTMGVNIWLGPVSSGPLGRSVLGGRNWEGWGPDQYLNGIMTRTTITHAQKNGLMTCVKHFIGYEQETFRDPFPLDTVDPQVDQLPISSNFDDRTAHEVYMWSFADAVRVGATTIMCSYNTLNGSIHSCGDDYTLNHYLQGELNFKGAVITDWGGLWNNSDFSATSVYMPGGEPFNATFKSNITSGIVSEERITDAVIRTLTPYYAVQLANQDSWPTPGFDVRDLTVPSRGARKTSHSLLIDQIAAESFTLVKNVKSKNESRGLPLKDKNEIQSVAVLGGGAGPNPYGWTSCGTFGTDCPSIVNGTLPMGGGSGWAYPPYVIDPAASIQHYARFARFDVNLALTVDSENIKNQANVSESALVFVNAYAKEGADRLNLTLYEEGDRIINDVASVNNDTIVVIHSSGAVLMPWIDHPNITAVAYAYYPGQETGTSLPRLLWGDINPSGKLPFVVARNESDYLPHSIITNNVSAPQSDFNDTLFVDYKWLQHQNTTPLFAFGHGMSYTTFEYGDLSLQESYDEDSTTTQPTNEQWDNSRGRATSSLYEALVLGTINVTNSGDCFGKEVAQIYIEFPEEIGEPVRALRGFEKLSLQPGETQQAGFRMSRKDVSYWDVVSQQWVIAPGTYRFHAGASSVDIRSTATYKFQKN